MIRILLPGVSLSLILLVSCLPKPTFTDVIAVSEPEYLPDYSSYCKRQMDDEHLAVFAAFFGDYENSIRFATKDASPRGRNVLKLDGIDHHSIQRHYKARIDSGVIKGEELIRAKKLLGLLRYQYDRPDYFDSLKGTNAVDFIVSQTGSFQFLLINEAHYSSQHRMFTNSLLKPLWDKGYRYLALETLYHSDDRLNERGYVSYNSGYYTKDPAFARLVNNALKMGYKLVAYESQSGAGGTERDYNQALNLFNATVSHDPDAKVLVHAGYAHILETGDDNYRPMGHQLKKLLKGDILTVDQEHMVHLYDSSKVHPLYREASGKMPLNQPTVFITRKEEAFVEPGYLGSIDIQVYHPQTQFKYHRPLWLKTKGTDFYKIPDNYLSYEGSLIQAVRVDAVDNTVPSDQTIIRENSALILEPGTYQLRIIDCNGTLIGKAMLEAK